jgi:hypothetical protein
MSVLLVMSRILGDISITVKCLNEYGKSDMRPKRYYSIHRVPDCLSLRRKLGPSTPSPLEPKWGWRHTRLRGRRRKGVRDPIPTKGQILWYFKYTIIPLCMRPWPKLIDIKWMWTEHIYCWGGGGDWKRTDVQYGNTWHSTAIVFRIF